MSLSCTTTDEKMNQSTAQDKDKGVVMNHPSSTEKKLQQQQKEKELLSSLPKGVSIHPDWITSKEKDELMAYFQSKKNDWQQEGFHKKLRVLYMDDSSSSSMIWSTLCQRLMQKSNFSSSYPKIRIEERTTLAQSKNTTKDLNHTIASVSQVEDGDMVAYLVLQHPIVQILSIQQSLDHDYHATNIWDVFQPPNSLIIKQSYAVSQYRYRIGNYHPIQEIIQPQQKVQHQRKIYLIKFYTPRIPLISNMTISSYNYNNEPKNPAQVTIDKYDDSEHKSSFDTQKGQSLRELLTIIVTTSPIKSNPSTNIIQGCFNTFPMAGVEFAYQCPKIIICDGCRISEDLNVVVTKQHANAKQSLRNGIATKTQAENYEEYKSALHRLCDSDPIFQNTKIIELSERHGYGFALRHAIAHHVQTPYVCVIQHDRTFMKHTPIAQVVYTMHSLPEKIKYVGMSMRSNLLYRDGFLSKYGKVAFQQLLPLILTPPSLCIEKQDPTENTNTDQQEQHTNNDTTYQTVGKNKKMQKNLLSLQNTYWKSQQYLTHTHKDDDDKNYLQCSLTPTLFWYDNIHVCETSHYRDFIFDERLKLVARGGFVEDKTSPAIIKNVERLGLQQGHAKFGCYLLDDHTGMFYTGHLDGGSYLTPTQQQHQKRTNLQQQQQQQTFENNQINK